MSKRKREYVAACKELEDMLAFNCGESESRCKDNENENENETEQENEYLMPPQRKRRRKNESNELNDNDDNNINKRRHSLSKSKSESINRNRFVTPPATIAAPKSPSFESNAAASLQSMNENENENENENSNDNKNRNENRNKNERIVRRRKPQLREKSLTSVLNGIHASPPHDSKYESPNKPGRQLTPLPSDIKSIFKNNKFFIANEGARGKKWSDLSDIRMKALGSIIPNHGGTIVKDAMNADIIICSNHLKAKEFNFLFPKIDSLNGKLLNWHEKHFVTADFITKATIHRIMPDFKEYEPKCAEIELRKQLTKSKEEKKWNSRNFAMANIDYEMKSENEIDRRRKEKEKEKEKEREKRKEKRKMEGNFDKYSDLFSDTESGSENYSDHGDHNNDKSKMKTRDNDNNDKRDKTKTKTKTKSKEKDNENENESSKKEVSWVDLNREEFACQIINSGDKPNFNARITRIFEELQDGYNVLGDTWREYSYKKAVGIIKKYPKRIKTKQDIEELMKVKGFSKKLGKKVAEILKTGTLEKLKEMEKQPAYQTLKLFTKIWGVGNATATKWYNQGLRTLDDVREKAKLDSRQQIGLKYYNDLLIKIPRSEVHEIELFVANVVESIEKGCKVVVCGSYRRGKPSSGDVDILVTHSKKEKVIGLCDKIIVKLRELKFLIDDYSVPSHSNKHEEHDTYMGICRLPDKKIYRHIDIKVYTPVHFAFAVLYFTGSDHFNRSMRYFAKKKGYSLSDHGLTPAIRVNNEKIYEGQSIVCKTEQEIFEALGLKYVKPTERNVYENFGSTLDWE